ncbi:histamine N-methyltransferase-like [Amphiura filiformis]|uniref:histamine N-methyltransferase-like n=1 Tax=Amphiura filiformis TaxID=82378 RepID=UPI003B219170
MHSCNNTLYTISYIFMMATENGLQSILDDDTYFVKSFDVFMNRILETDWSPDIIAKLKPKVIQSVNEATGNALKALGVGCGSGYREDFFVSHFQPHFAEVHQCIVEPNKDLINQHKNNVLQNDMKGVIYEWHEEPVEEFIASAKEDEKYHFISAIHCLYHVQNLEEILGFLYDKLQENGILLTMLTSETGLIGRVGSIAPSQYSKLFSPSSRSILDYFRTRGISCEVYDYPIRVDVSGCFDTDPSDEASLLLDFLTHVKDFTKVPTSEMKEEVFATIREMVANSPRSDCTAEAQNTAVIVHKTGCNR